MPPDTLFHAVDTALESNSPAEALDLLADEFRRSGRYDLLFEARGMRKRLELGLPLIQTEPSSSFPEHVRPAYEDAMIAAAREAGNLHLAAGNIPAAYRYLRLLGETGQIAASIENAEPGEDLDAVISIAFENGVHPVKGLDLILRNHGMCRAITAFGMHEIEKDREKCIALLVRELHGEIVNRMRHAIEQQEGAAPAQTSVPELMAGRDWLFGEYDYYVDTSHLTSLIPYCLEVTDRETLRLLDELCEYGTHLSPNFAFKAQPPFEDGYVDYGHYIKAALGIDTEEHTQHFRDKAAHCDPEIAGSAPAQLLVTLLARLDRYQEALDVFQQYLADEDPTYHRCPNALQLCHAAQNYEQMRGVAREHGDILSYAAASLLSRSRQPA
jgi:hypothetical protein